MKLVRGFGKMLTVRWQMPSWQPGSSPLVKSPPRLTGSRRVPPPRHDTPDEAGQLRGGKNVVDYDESSKYP